MFYFCRVFFLFLSFSFFLCSWSSKCYSSEPVYSLENWNIFPDFLRNILLSFCNLENFQVTKDHFFFCKFRFSTSLEVSKSVLATLPYTSTAFLCLKYPTRIFKPSSHGEESVESGTHFRFACQSHDGQHGNRFSSERRRGDVPYILQHMDNNNNFYFISLRWYSKVFTVTVPLVLPNIVSSFAKSDTTK